MKIYLAALGWVSDEPAGNRLRWHYPVDSVVRNRYMGLPEVIVVERSWLKEDIEGPVRVGPRGGVASVSAPAIPFTWWDHFGDVRPTGSLPPTHVLPWSAQAVRFVYRGHDTRLVVRDSDNGIVVDRMIGDGEPVDVSAPDIRSLVVYSIGAVFSGLDAVDLFRERGLTWEDIAHIRVADTPSVSLAEAASRYGRPTTLAESEWADLAEAASRARTSRPTADGLASHEPTAWQAYRMMIGIRWEFAVLCGHGFFDGPRTDWPRIDDVREDVALGGVPQQAVAYRVREEAKRVEPSCVAVCPPWMAAPLVAPAQPTYENPEVRLTSDVKSGEPKFTATYGLRWTCLDPVSLGVEVNEEISVSPTPTVASAPSEARYFCRTRLPDDPARGGTQPRSQDVAFHDVRLRCRMRAIDGWDRTSPFTAPTSWASLKLCHDPAPPSLATAVWEGGVTSLSRQVGDPYYPDWTPDLVVRHDPGARVLVYRRKTGAGGRPETTAVTVGAPAPLSGSGNRYRAAVSGCADLTPFDGGYLVSPPFKAMVRCGSGGEVLFDVGRGDSTLFGAGPAELQQNPLDLSLWDEVAEFSAQGLPDVLVFADPTPAPGETADVLSYHTRISCLGARVGPPSNTVQALRMPTVPVKPPPFSVDLLGVDFYDRTLVEVTFTNPVGDGAYTIWWANGSLGPAEFSARAVPGVLRAQEPYGGRVLFDVLALPLPQTVDRTITVGVQRVTEGEGQSAFETVTVTLPCLAS